MRLFLDNSFIFLLEQLAELNEATYNGKSDNSKTMGCPIRKVKLGNPVQQPSL